MPHAACRGSWRSSRHKNRPGEAWFDRSYKDELNIPGAPFKALHDATVLFSGQPVAVVLGETFEAARYAASLVAITYQEEAHNIDFEVSLAEKFLPKKKRNTYHPPKTRGEPDKAFDAAALQAARGVPSRHRAPQSDGDARFHGRMARRRQDHRLRQDPGQPGRAGLSSRAGSASRRRTCASSTPMSAAASARGCGRNTRRSLRVLAAKKMERSVRVVMTRQQMFTHAHRPECTYSIKLGAETTGMLHLDLSVTPPRRLPGSRTTWRISSPGA